MVYDGTLKREIPATWSIKNIASLIRVQKNGDWGNEKAKSDSDKEVVCIRGADINGLLGATTLNPPTRFIKSSSEKKLLNTNDLIIEISGGSPTQSTGRSAFITEFMTHRFVNPLICSNFCKALTLKNTKSIYYFSHLWGSLYDAGVFFNFEGKTSGIKNLMFDQFVTTYHLAVPPDKMIDRFYEVAHRLEAQKQLLLQQNQSLLCLRDWLLPFLMNGQVLVKN